MLYALTADEIQAAEERAVASGITLGELMERAGTAVAADAAAGAPSGRIVVVTGKGNNGGDGWVAARELHSAGRDVGVLAFAAPDELDGPAADAARTALAAGVRWTRPASDAELVTELAGSSLVIDALFGFGFRGPAREPFARAIEAINDCDAAVLAVDMPSGVDADTGAVDGAAVRADVTLTFTAPKVGVIAYPGAECAGEVRVADIGVPRRFVDEVGRIELLDDDDFRELFPATRPGAHKNSRGRVLVVAGSRGMTGAATLASTAALRLGAGYVTLACPDSLLDTLATKLTPVVLRPLPEEAPGILAPHAAEEVLRLADHADAVVLGPGLTREPGPLAVARRLVAELGCPLLVDADALNAHERNAEALTSRGTPTVLTPHPGELSRVLGVPAGEIQSARLRFGAALATDHVACVLKGARTVVTGGGRQSIETAGNQGMATAGSGDVLAGMCGALLAKGLPAYEAAVLGVHLHARAGDVAAGELTVECVTAPDILARIPDAVAELLGR